MRGTEISKTLAGCACGHNVAFLDGGWGNPLDGLPQPLLALGTRRLLSSYGASVWCRMESGATPPADATLFPSPGGPDPSVMLGFNPGNDVFMKTWYDQSGHGKDLNQGEIATGPRVVFGATNTIDGPSQLIPAPLFSPDGGITATPLSRSDALGLTGDPALTIAWRMAGKFLPAGLGTLLSLGTPSAPECNILLAAQAPDLLVISDEAENNGLFWSLPGGTCNGNSSYIITKAAGVGYDGSWTLSIDGIDQGPPAPFGPTLNIANLGCMVGQDLVGGPFFLSANLATLLVWDQVLTGGDIAQLDGFLASQ